MSTEEKCLHFDFLSKDQITLWNQMATQKPQKNTQGQQNDQDILKRRSFNHRAIMPSSLVAPRLRDTPSMSSSVGGPSVGVPPSPSTFLKSRPNEQPRTTTNPQKRMKSFHVPHIPPVQTYVASPTPSYDRPQSDGESQRAYPSAQTYQPESRYPYDFPQHEHGVSQTPRKRRSLESVGCHHVLTHTIRTPFLPNKRTKMMPNIHPHQIDQFPMNSPTGLQSDYQYAESSAFALPRVQSTVWSRFQK